MMKYLRMSKFVLFLLLLFCSCIYVFGVVLELNDLKSSNIKKRESTQKKILNDQAKLIHQLIQYASVEVKPDPKPTPDFPDEYPWHDPKHLSILLLGELRAIDAIPILISNIEYRNLRTLIVGSAIELDGMYPVVEALSKIGMPSIDPVIKKMGTYNKDCQGRQNCFWIIHKVLGVKLGRYKLQLAIEETKDIKVKKNLQAVLSVFKTLQEKLDAERARRDKEKQKQK